MKDDPYIASIAALIGDPARANILTALMSGKALTATELAGEAGVTPQTASSHLVKLTDGQLVQVLKQGRHKYFSLASDQVAETIESLMGLAAATGQLRTRTGPRNKAMREARVCYNHLAGVKGIQLFDALKHRDYLLTRGDQIALSPKGEVFVAEFGIDLTALGKLKAPLCKQCLDWSERRSHLAGSLGRALYARIEQIGWAKRVANTRIVEFSSEGEAAFDAAFSVSC